MFFYFFDEVLPSVIVGFQPMSFPKYLLYFKQETRAFRAVRSSDLTPPVPKRILSNQWRNN
jgi:hypothetical protein